MIEVYCINDTYPKAVLIFWEQINVDYPKKGNLYTVQEVITRDDTTEGYILHEINNEGKEVGEISFNKERFIDLNSINISEYVEEVEEITN